MFGFHRIVVFKLSVKVENQKISHKNIYFCLLLKYRISGKTKLIFLNAQIWLELNSGCSFRHTIRSPAGVTYLCHLPFGN